MIRTQSAALLAATGALVLGVCAQLQETKPAAQVQELPVQAANADAAYADVLELLRAGRQADAENLLERAVVNYPKDVRLLFARGVLARSRWGKFSAGISFSAVQALEGDGPFTAAGAACIQMDAGLNVQAGFEALRDLMTDHPDNLFFRWLFAIQCREQRQFHEEGAQAYEYILAQWKPGPVMVHHTYANILTESLDRPEDALPHRWTAQEMAPRGWTYQGMANTLKELNRLDEACAAFAKAVELAPGDPDYTRQWARALYEAERFEEAVEAFDQAVAADPANTYNHKTRAKCLSRLRRAEEAAAGYERAHALGCDYSAGYLASLYYRGINCTPNEELGLKWARIAADEHNNQLGLTILIDHYGSNAVPEKNDAEKALYYADKLMVKESVSAACFDGVAAAYARAGKFEKAIELQQRFIEYYSRGGYRELRENARYRLALYEQGKTYPENGFFELGMNYYYGRNGCPKDAPRALALFEQAAAAGDVRAYREIGRLCWFGRDGVEKDSARAAEALEKGYELGQVACAAALGAYCYNGYGSPRQIERGVKWLHIAADQHDDLTSMRHLAGYYGANETADLNDPEKAVYYAEKLLAENPQYHAEFAAAAAAYARAGQFQKAVELQEKCVKLLEKKYPEPKYAHLIDRAEERLSLYRQEDPYPTAAAQ